MNDAVETCRKTWKRLGVAREVREEMSADLEAELVAAAQDGVSPADFVSGDAAAFATEWALGRGVARTRPRVIGSAIAAVAGAIPGTGFALFVAYGLSSDAFAEMFPRLTAYLGSSGAWALLVLYAVGAAFAYAGAVAGVGAYLRWREDTVVAPTLQLLIVALPFGTAAAIGSAIALAWTQEFSTGGVVVISEVVVGGAIFAAAVGLGRAAAVSRSGGTRATAG
ncbi:MAG: hypothetical protein QOF45_301 [Gaiellaceae bacterium]|nr:hypothetical protein [Gaiellaceae bacterium]